ncbi:V-type proton ATPase 116 kDa subunit a 1-like [Rhynchophorus ferrugineus]|uniref:V-type proton ATPase 116 kDa subunit a 1-like n=1 Tax=Rhynchophorus ferrugineus TaxID=354439 RepID=UPI003FCC4139
MGAMFRSEEMALLQLFIQPEVAYQVVSELGEVGCLQFRDLNEDVNLFQREYANDISRCNEMERQIRYIEQQIEKNNISVPSFLEMPKAPNPRQSVDLEAHLEKIEQDLKELTKGSNSLNTELSELIETKHVLSKAGKFFSQKDDIFADYNAEERRNASQLNFISGVIPKEKVFAFERMLFRVGRGNIFVRQEDIDEPFEDPDTGVQQKKCVFIVFYQGENLHQKTIKIASAFRGKIVQCPVLANDRNTLNQKVATDIEDLKKVLNQTQDHITRLLVAVAKDVSNWNVMVCKMKAIYHTLNYFNVDVSKKCLIAEGWVPTGDLDSVYAILNAQASDSPVHSFFNILQTNDVPPTFNRTNKFTQGFQNLISAYGTANYRELNPALYSIVTFPFLFAVMFGDLGHAMIMAAFGAWLVISEKKIAAQKDKGEIFSIFFGGRYIILLMGLFSMYTGLLYNDIFSKSMNIFGSKWRVYKGLFPTNDSFSQTGDDDTTESLTLDPKYGFTNEAYFFGMDPVWQSADNKIIFLNSFKMKLSIIFGVVHMLFGIILNIVNHIQFKRYYALFLDFLPKLVFFSLLFIYLATMIVMKWFLYSASNEVDAFHDSKCAPSVLIYFIGMMLYKKIDDTSEHGQLVCKAYMYDGQETVQHKFLYVALLCIPVLLFGSPIYHWMKKKKPKAPTHAHHNNHSNSHQPNGRQSSRLSQKHEDLQPIPENAELVTHEEPMSEIMVHQAIETIEFTLSTVSHTASYLRLWALSLAHSQLSDVLWSMVFQKGLKVDMGYISSILIYVFFIPWAICTVGILVLMEGLSAFLHTLRLHWVEFMNKFYKGEGYNFTPFSFKNILSEED